MIITLVRHGETDWNAAGRWQGRTDNPLNDKGRAQARLVAERLRSAQVGHIYASPLSRAMDTARALSETVGAGIIADERLMEVHPGHFEGMFYEEMKLREDFNVWLGGETPAPGGGESFRGVYGRVHGALHDIAVKENGDFIITAHAIVIRVVVNKALGLAVAERSKYVIDNCSITRVSYKPDTGRLMMVTLNELV